MCVKGQATDVMIHAEEMMRAKKQLIALYSKHTRQPINTIGSHRSDKSLLLQNTVQLFLDVRSIVLVMRYTLLAGLQCQPFFASAQYISTVFLISTVFAPMCPSRRNFDGTRSVHERRGGARVRTDRSRGGERRGRRAHFTRWLNELSTQKPAAAYLTRRADL